METNKNGVVKEEAEAPSSSSISSQNNETSNAEQKKSFLGFDDFNSFYEKKSKEINMKFIKLFLKNFSKNLKETAATSKLPIKTDDLDFYMTIPSFKQFIGKQNDRILKLISNLLKQNGIKRSITSSKLDDDERMDLLIDTNDQIIEKLSIELDELQGLRKKTETELKLTVNTLKETNRSIKTSWNKNIGMVAARSSIGGGEIASPSSNSFVKQSPASAASSFSEQRVDITKRQIVHQKPQKMFKDRIDNSHLPFVPKLRTKPNALRELPEIFGRLDDSQTIIDKNLFEKHPLLLENPYAYEIEQCEMLDITESSPVTPASLDETPFEYVDSLDLLIKLCEHLGKSNRSRIKEIAVDLEHHSYRSFAGFTCLMQISTRNNDYIVDTIKLRSELYRLNEIFTDWTLLKVFHGADFDIEWLQKDFGIYVVNMFDTGQASRILQYPHHSLSYLLKVFCNVDAQKQFQLADWRIRPLSSEMLKYAREDTHYLLFIYDNLRNDLIKLQETRPLFVQQGSTYLKQVHENSKLICKKVYRKPAFITKGFLNLCTNNSHLNSKQTKALHDLYAWRDRVARESDESPEYVLKGHQMLKIAELLPREHHGILALCNPVTTMLEANVHELHEIVKAARDFTGVVTSNDLQDSTPQRSLTMNGPSTSFMNQSTSNIFSQSMMISDSIQRPSALSKTGSVLETVVHSTTYDPNSILNCPHDLPHVDDQQSENMMSSMEIQPIEHALSLNLKELFIKPNRRLNDELVDKNNKSSASSLSIQNLFIPKESSKLEKMFTKEARQAAAAINNNNRKAAKKLLQKVNEINETIENPFEMYMPTNLRSTTQASTKWSLLKPIENNNNDLQKDDLVVSSSQKSVELVDESFVIPLKHRIRTEKNKKKKIKEESIVHAYKQIKKDSATSNNDNFVVGSDEAASAMIAETIKANLKSLASSVKKTVAAATSTPLPTTSASVDADDDDDDDVQITKSTTSRKAFNYDDQNIQQMFTKARNLITNSNGSSTTKRNNKKNMNKKRAKNSVSNAKNSMSLTYKSK